MKRFCELLETLGSPEHTIRSAALLQYFAQATQSDMMQALTLLMGHRPKRIVSPKALQSWAIEAAEISSDLFERCLSAVGDISQTAALIIPLATHETESNLTSLNNQLRDLSKLEDEEKKQQVYALWATQSTAERAVFNKLLIGAFRAEAKISDLAQAIAGLAQHSPENIALRLAQFTPSRALTWEAVFLHDCPIATAGQPRIGPSAAPSAASHHQGPDWQATPLWPGVWVQAVIAQGQLCLWRMPDPDRPDTPQLLTHPLPELAALTDLSDGTILEGQLVIWPQDAPHPVAGTEARLARKSAPKSVRDSAPVHFEIFDILAQGKTDLQLTSLKARQDIARALCTGMAGVSVAYMSQAGLASKPQLPKGSTGLLLWHPSIIAVPAPRITWHPPHFRLAAVLLYAAPSNGRQGALRDFSFAIWQGNALVTIAKIDIGRAENALTPDEIDALAAWAKTNTVERFGPVRQLVPERIFEISYAQAQPSTRHKSGVILSLPALVRPLPKAQLQDIPDVKTLQTP